MPKQPFFHSVKLHPSGLLFFNVKCDFSASIRFANNHKLSELSVFEDWPCDFEHAAKFVGYACHMMLLAEGYGPGFAFVVSDFSDTREVTNQEFMIELQKSDTLVSSLLIDLSDFLKAQGYGDFRDFFESYSTGEFSDTTIKEEFFNQFVTTN